MTLAQLLEESANARDAAYTRLVRHELRHQCDSASLDGVRGCQLAWALQSSWFVLQQFDESLLWFLGRTNCQPIGFEP